MVKKPVRCELIVSNEGRDDGYHFQLRLPIVGFFRSYWGHGYKTWESATKAGKRYAKKFGWVIKNDT